MVKITNDKLEVTKELFLEAYDMYKRSDLTRHDAYDAAVSYFTNEGYKVRHTTFESFKRQVLYKQR